jgi:FkbM family methyltransferase
MLNSFAGSVQGLLSRSRLGVVSAIKFKRQCDGIIGQRVGSGIAHDKNGEAWLVRRIAPSSKMFVDVGANVGAWSLMFASEMGKEPRGLLFEPSPPTARKLREVINAASLKELEVIACAVGDRSGSAMFHVESDHGETASLVAGHSLPGSTPVLVQVTTLDDEIANRKLGRVDFLKIDAEGFDLRVLKGAESCLRQQLIKVVQFEYNHPWAAAGSTLADAYRYLESFGYKVRLLKSDALYKLDPKLTGEYYKYSNFVAYCPDSLTEILESNYHPSII